MHMRYTLWLGTVLFVASCSIFRGRPAPPGTPNLDRASIETGSASWYGPGFQARRTASGEPFDQNALTAAHRSLPLGTRVRVTNLENGRSVDLRINDRGPFVRGRTLDMSYRAAKSLRIVGRGATPVRVEVLRRGSRRHDDARR